MDITEQTTASTNGAETDEGKIEIPSELSLLPLKDTVLFPQVVMPLAVTREASIKLIDDAAVANNRIIGVVALRDSTFAPPQITRQYYRQHYGGRFTRGRGDKKTDCQPVKESVSFAIA